MVDRMDKRKPVKLTRSEKKAMRRTEKLAVKLEKEQERADKIRRKKEALERAGRNNSLQIYEPVEKNIEKYQELRADMNHLYQKIY